MSDEKAPLVPRFDATRAMPGAAPRHRCAAKKTALRVLGATAAAGILYYNIPEGNDIDPHTKSYKANGIAKPHHTQLKASCA